MKRMLTTTIAALGFFAVAAASYATEYTKGTVQKIDTKSGKVTVKHEELKNLDMPAMTMVFRAKDEAMLGRLKEGSDIEFIVERVEGKLTLVEVK